MSDVVEILKSLFPTAQITSTYRSPKSRLGMLNPRSYHNIGKAIDIAPIPGIKFKDYVKSLENAGVNIVEALEEVGKGRSKYATGNHWHIAYDDGQKSPKSPKAPEKAPEEVKMASAEAPDMPEAPDFDIEAETESNFASLLAGLGKKKKGKKKAMGILAGII